MKVSGKDIQFKSQEFKGLFERLFPSLCMLATRILDDDEKGKDIAQEAFVKLWEKDNQDFTDENALRAYMYVLVKNACISQLRKDKRINNTALHDNLHITDQEYLNQILREETYRLLHQAISELSPQAEQVVTLTLKGYSNELIGAELGISVNTVKTVKKRAYKALKQKLGNHFVEILLTVFIQFF
ncbi:RNA polymerase sigma factor [Robertkochia solimangrovi]|uniref:RNA polymerase sigma factor n=1 Tax=Robertkochia solimangrovi TaxID=2213046 RepID=UPI00117BE1C4|nr:sigma-70 family RNA polymerase sigma factor [Robertkochia solimangrovi]TRZ45068.1 RNA polymerase sigma-70 factor [Robertkochia solimangrovi]